MPAKEIKYTDDARKLLEVGVDKLANAVKVTLRSPSARADAMSSSSASSVARPSSTTA